METRRCKISVGKPGGSASSNAKSYRLCLPNKWMYEMGITPEERDVTISFNGNTIEIKKAELD